MKSTLLHDHNLFFYLCCVWICMSTVHADEK